MKVKVAAAQYSIGFHKNWSVYADKVTTWVDVAAENGAKILLFPEYSSMELTSLFGGEVYESLEKQLTAMQSLLADFLKLFQSLAINYQCYIQAGSFPVCNASGDFHNHAYLFMPDGQFDFQEKLQMTRFESERWNIKSGSKIKVFATDYGSIAINICYDSEFPLFARKQVESGANLILVPSCTDTLAGYHRVRIGCQARALENQCYVVQSPTVGPVEWNQAVDENIGAAAIYTPVDIGFPDNGILAIGEINKAQWVYADIDLGKIAEVRKNGQVSNYRDWELQKNFLN